MKTLKIENLENVLKELQEDSKNLITYGNTNERNRGWGMLEVIELIKFSYTDNLKDKIDDLMVTYIEGGNYSSLIKVLTNDLNKYELITIELTEYYNEFLDSPEDHDPCNYYIDNIIRILNN